MEIKLPLYLKAIFLLIGLALIIWFLQLFKAVLVPIVFSALLAFLLLPLCQNLEKRGVYKPVAISVCIVLILTFLGLLIWFFTAQLLNFVRELHDMSSKLNLMIEKMQIFLQKKIGFAPRNNSTFIRTTLVKIQEKSTELIGSTISVTTGAMTTLTLIPIYIFCFLYYRSHMRQFIFKLITPERREPVMKTIGNVQRVAANYISGLITVIVIVALLNSTGLLIMGVKYAFFFGAFASCLIVIPYIGMLIGAILPAIFTLVETGSTVDALIVIGIFAFVQFLEGNFITPYITGSKVSINPFAAIVALIIGGEIWGAVGMVLSIPIIAILKVLFDAYTPLAPFGFLLGDTKNPDEEPGRLNRLFSRIRSFFSRNN